MRLGNTAEAIEDLSIVVDKVGDSCDRLDALALMEEASTTSK